MHVIDEMTQRQEAMSALEMVRNGNKPPKEIRDSDKARRRAKSRTAKKSRKTNRRK